MLGSSLLDKKNTTPTMIWETFVSTAKVVNEFNAVYEQASLANKERFPATMNKQMSKRWSDIPIDYLESSHAS